MVNATANQTPPIVNPSRSTALSGPVHTGLIVAQANKSHVITAQKLRAVRAKIEALESEKNALETDLKAAFQVDEFTLADELRTGSGQLLATWKEVFSFPINTKKLAVAFPAVADEFREMKRSRRFILK